MRKLFTALTAIIALALGVIQAGPAQAWPDSTSDVTTWVGEDYRWDLYPIGKSVTSEMVYLYTGSQQSDNSYFIKTLTVSPSGEVRGPFTVASNLQNKFYRTDSEQYAWIDSKGTFNLIYSTGTFNQDANQTTLNYVTSVDGQFWSTPTVLETTAAAAGSVCLAQMFTTCGIRHYSVATNSLGVAALSYVVVLPDNTSKIFYRNKPVGKPWSAGTALNTNNNILRAPKISAAGKGWLVSWTFSDGPDELGRLMSSFSTGDKGSSFTAPQLRAEGFCLDPQFFHQTAVNKFALIYEVGCDVNTDPLTLRSQTFDATTSRFGTAQVLYAFQGWANPVLQTQFVGGQSAIGFSDYVNRDFSFVETAKYIIFRNGVGTIQNVNVDASQGISGNQNVVGIHLDVLGHLSVVWQSSRSIDQSLTVSSFYRGNRSDADVTFPGMVISNGGNLATFSPDGDVYLTNYLYNDRTIKARVRIRSDAPDLMSEVKILGAAKSNATLAVKLPLVTPNSIGQRWNFTYKWYSCQYRVTEVLSISTQNCSAISGATAATYKVKPADKGKFLQVRLNVTSDNTSQLQYSASTVAAK